MTREQRRRRTWWVASAIIALTIFLGCAWLHLGAGVRADLVVLLWWSSALATCLCGVEACTVDDDGIERPRYLGSLLSGLRQEWSHSSAGSRPPGL